MNADARVVRLTDPAAPVVSRGQVTSYLRIDSASETDHIDLLIAQATEEIERFTGRALIQTSFRLDQSTWPQREAVPAGVATRQQRLLEVPRTPLVSVTSVKYYDEDGVLQTLSSGSYIVSTSLEPGAIFLSSDDGWPTLDERPDAVQVTFVAGYGTGPGCVPPSLKQAALLLCRHFYAGGNPNQFQTPMSDLDTAHRLMQQFRVGGWTG